MKRTDPLPISEIIERAINQGDNRRQMLEQRACWLWNEIVGPVIAKYTFRRYVEKGVMHVFITSASLKNDVSFYRSSITQKINEILGETVITEIAIH